MPTSQKYGDADWWIDYDELLQENHKAKNGSKDNSSARYPGCGRNVQDGHLQTCKIAPRPSA